MKLLVLRRERLSMLLCLALALGMIWLVDHPHALGAAGEARVLPIYSVEREEKVVALTFDAAWGNEDTEELISILGDYGAKATFFLVGEWVEKYPESVRALHQAGHSIQNHSESHPHLTQCDRETLVRELESCNDRIQAITGIRPTLHRCPYGDYDNGVVETIHSVGMEAIQWDVDSLDWKDLTAPEITRRVLEGVGPGSIVLFHNAALHTPEALPAILEALSQEGYQFVTVEELLLDGERVLDHTGRQQPAGGDGRLT